MRRTLIVVAAVEKALRYGNKKTVSSTAVLSGSDVVHGLLDSVRRGEKGDLPTEVQR